MALNLKTKVCIVNKAKGLNDKIGFAINDVPLWLYKQFTSDVKQKYNDIYWVKLMDLMRKAEAYDSMLASQGYMEEPMQEVENVEKETKEQKPLVMDGSVKI